METLDGAEHERVSTGTTNRPRHKATREFLAAMRAKSHASEAYKASKERSYKAAVTNDPFKLSGHASATADRRRWRDIILDLKERLGEEKFKRESVRVKIVAIANLTLLMERETEGVIEGTAGKLVRKADYDKNGHPHTLVYREGNVERTIHIIGQISSLLKSIGINDEK